MLTGDALDGRFEALDAADYDLPGVERRMGRDTRLNTAVIIDTITSVAPTAVRRSALRAMSVRDPRLGRIVAVNGGPSAGVTVIVSEPLPGVTLKDVLARRRLDEAKARALVGEAARALSVASAAGVHHGWLRPACIAIDSRGRVTVGGVGTDGELALQAGIRRGKGEPADATALSRVLLACVTGKDADVATAADVPGGVSDATRALCADAIAGKTIDSLSALLARLGPFDTRVLRGLPAAVDSLPLSLAAARDAERKRKRDRLEAARKALRSPRVTGGVVIAPETLSKAEAAAVTGSLPLVVHNPPPAAEPELLEDLHDMLTFEAMVEEQEAARKPTNSELLYERLHGRWPNSRVVTSRLAKAHDRAINGGPINATPIVMTLLAGGLVVVAIVAISLLTNGVGPTDDPGGDLSHYPAYTYAP